MTEERGLIEELVEKIGRLGDYDVRALEHYQAFGFYLDRRSEKVPPAVAARETCEAFGHDAPRGLCLRCGLGADSTDEEREHERTMRRVAQRDRFLASRGR